MGFISTTLSQDPTDLSQLAICHSKSDGAMFNGHEVLCLCDIDSSSEERDFRRMLLQAAFTVRFINETLQITDYTLPAFYIDKHLYAKCYVVFEFEKKV